MACYVKTGKQKKTTNSKSEVKLLELTTSQGVADLYVSFSANKVAGDSGGSFKIYYKDKRGNWKPAKIQGTFHYKANSDYSSLTIAGCVSGNNLSQPPSVKVTYKTLGSKSLTVYPPYNLSVVL